LVAPTGARAHAGHDHVPVQVEQSVSTPHTLNRVKSGNRLTDAVNGVSGTVWIAASGAPQGKAATSCERGCCHSAGQGCCAVALPAVITIAPPTVELERLFARFLWGPGITPGVLPEPPKYPV
jgi:hypothetical protein